MCQAWYDKHVINRSPTVYNYRTMRSTLINSIIYQNTCAYDVTEYLLYMCTQYYNTRIKCSITYENLYICGIINQPKPPFLVIEHVYLLPDLAAPES